MQFKTLAIVGLGLISTASAYNIILWENHDCTGNRRNDDVYDNTCSTPSPGFSSITVTNYGTPGQYARLHAANCCAGSAILGPWAADGSDSHFKINTCYELPAGVTANAAGSFAL